MTSEEEDINSTLSSRTDSHSSASQFSDVSIEKDDQDDQDRHLQEFHCQNLKEIDQKIDEFEKSTDGNLVWVDGEDPGSTLSIRIENPEEHIEFRDE